MTLLAANGSPLGFRSSYGFYRDRFEGPTLDPAWRQFADDHPDAFDRVGLVLGGVATTALTRPTSGGPAYVSNPANLRGAFDYAAQPGLAAPGIGGLYQDFNTQSVSISITYGGHYDYDSGLHSEATPVFHVTPDSDLHSLGCWYAELGPVGVGVIGGTCNPPEAITALDYAFFEIVDGTHPVFTGNTDGTGIALYVDGLQLPLVGHGFNRFPVPEELLGSTCHGVEIDQHIVDYTAGAPDLARMQSAPAFSDFSMWLR